jgi:hypothetical protein
MKVHPTSVDSFEFDLPSTSKDDFTRALERIGDAKIEHPWFENDRNPYRENVSLSDATTTVSFDPKQTPE